MCLETFPAEAADTVIKSDTTEASHSGLNLKMCTLRRLLIHVSLSEHAEYSY